MVLVFVYIGGALKQEATSVTLVNNTELVIDKTVPAGMRWILKSIKVTNPDNVNRNVTIYKYKEVAKTTLIKYYYTFTALAAGTSAQIPNMGVAGNLVSTPYLQDEILDAGNTINITWVAGGASTGGVNATGLILEYLELNV